MIVILVEFQSLEKTAPRATLHKNFAIKHNETKSLQKDSEKILHVLKQYFPSTIMMCKKDIKKLYRKLMHA